MGDDVPHFKSIFSIVFIKNNLQWNGLFPAVNFFKIESDIGKHDVSRLYLPAE